jgi:hypothetical protein
MYNSQNRTNIIFCDQNGGSYSYSYYLVLDFVLEAFGAIGVLLRNLSLYERM